MARVPSYQTTAASLPINPNQEGVISPISPAISYPQVLDPEHGPQTIHRPDLFFVNSNSHMNARQNAEFSQRSSNTTSPSISNQLYPYHQQAFHHHPPPISHPPQNLYAHYQPPPPTYPQNQSVGNNLPLPPALPPKPIVYPTINTAPKYGQYHPNPPTIEQPPLPPPPEEEEYVTSPTDDSNELAMALALSQSESIERQKLQDELRDQEEEDLARALAESLLSTGSNANPAVNPFFVPMGDQKVFSSNTTEGTPRLAPSPVRAPSDLPPQSDFPSHPSNSPPKHSFPEFGLHEKWRIPGVSDNAFEESGDKLDQFGRKSSVKSISSSSHAMPPPEASPRPLSISSVSSLPYMRDGLVSETLDGKDADSQHGVDIDVTKDGRGDPSDSSAYTSPEITSTDPHPFPSWTTSQMADVYTESEEPNVLVFDDEAYARQLAAEEGALAAQEQKYANEKTRPMPIYDKDFGQPLPLYTTEDQQNGPISNDQSYASSSSNFAPGGILPAQTHPSQLPEYAQPAFNHVQPKPREGSDFKSISSLTNATKSSHFSPVAYPTLGNRHETESDTLSEVSHHSSGHSSSGATQTTQSGISSASSHNDHQSSTGALPVPAAAAMLNVNQFLDRELLLGVSIGFKPPAISRALIPMQDPMPNIISLPYARCPPLHLQAPDWRHLLRLMARLSGTRIEPTVEAMAISKTELKLRTVVQFIKPHPSANDWRTILWFTIDHPIPPAVPGASRYLSGNPNLLPWSYTLSPVPMLLRDAADTHISKTYTIPATESVPLPNLPITFPNLALYLQAALDASRRHSGDSSGLGKLGKVVQMCYPTVEQTFSEFDIPERTRVSDMFKRVMKRSNKDKKKGKTNNEETYQLVTPFVPDEWG